MSPAKQQSSQPSDLLGDLVDIMTPPVSSTSQINNAQSSQPIDSGSKVCHFVLRPDIGTL